MKRLAQKFGKEDQSYADTMNFILTKPACLSAAAQTLFEGAANQNKRAKK